MLGFRFVINNVSRKLTGLALYIFLTDYKINCISVTEMFRNYPDYPSETYLSSHLHFSE